jgi:protein phosphatase
MLNVQGLSHPGRRRKNNEDAMSWDVGLGCVAVADGMGGHQAGEIASQLALESIFWFLRKSASKVEFTWPFGVNPRLSLSANRLMTALKIGNRRVFTRSEENAEYAGMGTTVVAVLVEGSTITYASVGDSRIYSFADGRLQQLTRDDTWAAMLAKDPNITPEALQRHPMRNVLTAVLGAFPDLEVTTSDITAGDQVLLLCSDGLHTALSDEAIVAILSRERELNHAVEALVAAALEAGGSDNITAVLVRPGGHGER